MLPFAGGETIPVGDLLDQILRAQNEHQVEGVTLLGGEPFSHAQGAAHLAAQVRRHGMSVMIFSGFTLAEIRAQSDPQVASLLAETDLLVDGPYLQESPDQSRRWIGSTNQEIHFLSDRYAAEEATWSQPNTLEIRLEGSQLTVNGFPAPEAVGLWKRLPRTHS